MGLEPEKRRSTADFNRLVTVRLHPSEGLLGIGAHLIHAQEEPACLQVFLPSPTNIYFLTCYKPDSVLGTVTKINKVI